MNRWEKLSKNQMIELDEELAECAYLAMKPYLTNPVSMRRNRYSWEELVRIIARSLERFSPCLERWYAYIEKPTPHELSQEIIGEFLELIKRLRRNHVDREKDHRRNELLVAYPIMLYAVVVNNTYSKVAEMQRTYRASLRSNDSEANQEIQDEREGLEDCIEVKNIKRFQLCQITRKEAEIRTERKISLNRRKKRVLEDLRLMRQCFNSENKKRISELSFRKKYLLLGNTAQLLEEYTYFQAYVESAQIGLLLRDILSVEVYQDRVLDRLLRLYMANRMDQILMRTGIMNLMSPTVFFDIESPNHLLKWYYDTLHPSERDDYVGDYTQYLQQINPLEIFRMDSREICDNPPETVTSSNEADKNAPDFCSLYSKLTNRIHELCLTRNDVDDLVDFFLNKEKLKKVGNWKDIPKEHCDDLYKVLTGELKPGAFITYDHVLLTKVLRSIQCEKIVNDIQKVQIMLNQKKEEVEQFTKKK